MHDVTSGPSPLPVVTALPALRAALADPGVAVLVAPPGTGKTTGVPPELLAEPWVDGRRLLVLEPRRVAARAAAARMAATHGEAVGGTYGYAVRHDRKVGRGTRVEVVTEGLLTRRLQSDPGLDGVAAVLLDEFHERSLDVDLALALLLDVRESLRPDLRLLVMSATLDAGAVAALLGGDGSPAPVVVTELPIHPVTTHHRPGSVHDPLEDRVAAVVVEALAATPGDVLVFLPGRGEIARTARRLGDRLGRGIELLELHGSVPTAEQDRVLAGSGDGRRRVVLATSIAETSITVPGVRVVVDAGRRRSPRVDPRTGLPALVTGAVSQAGADQRRGRAGREAPGVCYRLWSEADERLRPAHDPPEITTADLAPLVLQTRAWGATRPDELRWLDPPPAPAVARAEALLTDLDALGADGRLTPRGKELGALGLHPRLGALAVAGRARGVPGLAAEVAAVVEVGGGGDREVAERVRALRAGRAPREVGLAARQWRRRLGERERPRTGGRGGPVDDDTIDRQVGSLLLAGFADRLAHRRPDRRDGRGRERAVYQLRHGGEVELDATSPLAGHDWLVVTDLDAATGSGRPGRVHLAGAVHRDDVASLVEHHGTEERTAVWDDRAGTVVATRRLRVDGITVHTRPWRDPDGAAVAGAVSAAVAERGPTLLARWSEADPLRARVAFLAAHGVPGPADGWPDLSEVHLTATVADWLGPALARVRSAGALARVDVASAVRGLLPWDAAAALDREAPTQWTAPSGRTFPLRYGAVDGDPSSVVLSARLQHLLGVDAHPTVSSRRVPVTVELLSPAGRPVQRTTDLPGFWRGSYAQVRAELRAKYRKHDWPERPWESPAGR